MNGSMHRKRQRIWDRARGAALTTTTATFALGLTLGLLGCPKQALVVDTGWLEQNSPGGEIGELLDEVALNYEAGQMASALELLDDARSLDPPVDIVAFIDLTEGMVLLRLGNPDEALTALDAASQSAVTELAGRAHLLMGLAQYQQGDHEKATSTLAKADPEQLSSASTDPELESELLDAAATLALARGDFASACAIYSWMTRKSGSDDEAVADAQVLVSKMDEALVAPPTLPLLESMTASGPFWALMATRAGFEALETWDIDTATSLVETLAEAGFASVATELTVELDKARQEMASTDPMTIGALLPLSGKNSGIGAMMKAGIETALRILGAEHDFEVVFLDTASDPDLARAQLRELKSAHHAIAAIGPATGPTATAVAQEADQLQIPLLSLSLKPGVPAASPWVFRHFTTHQAEVDTLASWAIEQSGMKHVAVIHPDTVYGKQMAALFTKAAQGFGAQVDLTLSFEPGESNFVPLATKIAAAPSVEAIFVPVTAGQLALIGPALAYEEVWASETPSATKDSRKVVLMAPQVAYSPTLPDKAGKFLQGTVFATGFWAETADPFASFFVSEFERDSAAAVNVYHAYAADSLFILAQGVVIGEARTREQLRSWLSDPSSCGPSTPTISTFEGFGTDGESTQPVSLVSISGAAFTPLSAGATTP